MAYVGVCGVLRGGEPQLARLRSMASFSRWKAPGGATSAGGGKSALITEALPPASSISHN